MLGETGYRVRHRVNLSEAEFLEQVAVQLRQGLPVPIYFSTLNPWNEPNYDTHYSVIIGLRAQAKTVVIANAYGYLEELPLTDLLSATNFANFRGMPLDFRLGLFFGVINQNNLFPDSTINRN